MTFAFLSFHKKRTQANKHLTDLCEFIYLLFWDVKRVTKPQRTDRKRRKRCSVPRYVKGRDLSPGAHSMHCLFPPGKTGAHSMHCLFPPGKTLFCQSRHRAASYIIPYRLSGMCSVTAYLRGGFLWNPSSSQGLCSEWSKEHCLIL